MVVLLHVTEPAQATLAAQVLGAAAWGRHGPSPPLAQHSWLLILSSKDIP